MDRLGIVRMRNILASTVKFFIRKSAAKSQKCDNIKLLNNLTLSIVYDKYAGMQRSVNSKQKFINNISNAAFPHICHIRSIR